MTHCRLAAPPGLEVGLTRQQKANDFWLCLRSGELPVLVTELLDLLREMPSRFAIRLHAFSRTYDPPLGKDAITAMIFNM